MLNTKTIHKDNLTLDDIISFLFSEWVKLSIGAITGLLVGITYFYLAPKIYESVAIIKPYSLAGNLLQADKILNDTANSIEFSQRIISQLDEKKGGMYSEELRPLSLFLKKAPNPHLIVIIGTGASPDDALNNCRDLAIATVKALNQDFIPNRQQLEKKLESIKVRIRRNEQQRATLRGLKNFLTPDALAYIAMTDAKFSELIIEKLEVEKMLSPQNTWMAEVIQEAHPPNTPKYPRKERIIFFTTILGLLVSIVVILLKFRWELRQQSLVE